MTKLPCLSGREVIAALKRLGCEKGHRIGSPVILRHRDPPHQRLTVPNDKESAKGAVRAILRQAGLTREEFFELLR